MAGLQGIGQSAGFKLNPAQQAGQAAKPQQGGGGQLAQFAQQLQAGQQGQKCHKGGLA